MNYTFVCHGGAGSVWLIKRLRRFCKVHARPEGAWLPSYFGRSIADFEQILDKDGYNAKPSFRSLLWFAERVRGFKVDFDPHNNINDILRDYYLWLSKTAGTTAVFNRAAIMGFFVKNKYILRNTVFIVRHPLHQYVSITKPGRHPELVKDFGGVNTTGGVEFWAKEWNSFVEDALGSGMPVLRYEFMHEDVSKLDIKLQKIFKKWDITRRNNGVLSTENENLLRHLTNFNFFTLYEDWNL